MGFTITIVQACDRTVRVSATVSYRTLQCAVDRHFDCCNNSSLSRLDCWLRHLGDTMAQKSVNSDKMLNLGYRVSVDSAALPATDLRLAYVSLLQVLMKRNSTYIAFVLAGALLGERVSTSL